MIPHFTLDLIASMGHDSVMANTTRCHYIIQHLNKYLHRNLAPNFIEHTRYLEEIWPDYRKNQNQQKAMTSMTQTYKLPQ